MSVHLISDFTVGSFAALLEQDITVPHLAVTVAPYNQVEPALLALAEGTSPAGEVVFVWTRPEAVIGSFAKLLRGEAASVARVLEEVDVFCETVTRAAAGCECLFIPLWTVPAHQRGLGLLDLKLQEQGIGAALMRMNGRMLERLSEVRNIYPLNAVRWTQQVGERSFNPKQWYLGKVHFANEVFREAVLDLKAGLSALNGDARKLLIVDLDNTLWGGIVGDTGWEGLTLGGHHAVGEAFVDFQRALKAVKQRGILLGIISKNDESVAMEALSRHPEMVLRPGDFAGWRISWGDKAESMAELVKELNLGLQSTVFIDDSAFERGRGPGAGLAEQSDVVRQGTRGFEVFRCSHADGRGPQSPRHVPRGTAARRFHETGNVAGGLAQDPGDEDPGGAAATEQPCASSAVAQQDQPDESENAPDDGGFISRVVWR
jgi:HAD superfamily phosphatase (TIGR01681 family)